MFASHAPTVALQHIVLWVSMCKCKAIGTRICCHKPYFHCCLSFGSWRVSLPSAIIWSNDTRRGWAGKHNVLQGALWHNKAETLCWCAPSTCIHVGSALRGYRRKSLPLVLRDCWPSPYVHNLWMLPSVTRSYKGTNLYPFHLYMTAWLHLQVTSGLKGELSSEG